MASKKKKRVHTCPELAGEKNLSGKKLPKDDKNINEQIYPVYLQGKENKKEYKGLWTEESLAEEIDNFFQYCYKESVKPTQPLLALWLGISKSQMWEWKTKPEKYTFKSNLIGEAMMWMESYLQANLDKYPTGSIFLLKSSHGHAETQNVNITSNGTSQEEVDETIKKLGLDKE